MCVCMHVYFQSLWTAFTCCCPLSWLPIWLQSEMVEPCFIHGHIFTQNLFVALKQLQTTLWIIDTFLFLISCEQTRHPLWTQLSHWQMFMRNDEYIAFWYLQLLCYLTQPQFMISQNKFVEFFSLFRDNCWIWATWAFSIIYVCTTTLKVSISPLYCFFLMEKSPNNISSNCFAETVFFPHQKAMLYQHTKFRYFNCFENLQQQPLSRVTWRLPFQ